MRKRVNLFQLNRLMSPFPILGLLGGIFHFLSTLYKTLCKQTVDTDQTDLGTHCLPLYHKNNVRHKRVYPLPHRDAF